MQLALDLARLGWAVFPCLENKAPACPHGFKDATRDPAEIAALWRAYPAPLIGIATGEASRVDVLDIDAKHPAAMEWAALRFDTMRIVTRSGGWHFYWCHHPGMRNSCARPMLGVDVRGDGGYAIWWDSNAPSPGRVLPWPAELLAELRPPPKPIERVVQIERPDNGDIFRLLQWVERAQEGERNARLHWAACRCAEKIRAGVLTYAEAHRYLVMSGTFVGLSQREAEATVRSGLAS